MTKWVLLTLLVGMLAFTRPVVNGLVTDPANGGGTVQVADGDPPADPDGGRTLPLPDVSRTV